jgi:hypothetical protein
VSFGAFVRQHLGTQSYLELHLELAAIAAVGGCWWAWGSATTTEYHSRLVTISQQTVWMVLGGPFGVAIGAMLLLPHAVEAIRSDAAAKNSETDEEHTGPTNPELIHSAMLDQRLRITDAHRTRPLLDVVLDGSTIEKFDALGLIAKRYESSLSAALRRALEDQEPAVRVLAATVIAKQHGIYANRVGRLQALTKIEPDCVEHWDGLGQAHRDYALSGLLDSSRANAELDMARTHITNADRLAIWSGPRANQRIATDAS